MNRRRLLIGLAALAVAVLIVSWSLVRTRAQKPPDQTASQAQSQTPTVIVTNVVSQELSRQVRLPGDLKAYEDVGIYPKIPGFVEWIGVDRGSVVKRGQLIARMAAPEVEAQSGEAAAKAQAAHAQRLEAEARAAASKSQRVEAEAKLAADEATYRHLRGASETPGVVAGNDLEIAEKTVEADRARVRTYQEGEKAAAAQVRAYVEAETAASSGAKSARDIQQYLKIVAPFDGVVTERNVHDGSLVGPASASNAQPMVRIQQVSTLRLVAYVPEEDVASLEVGEEIHFTVPAYPGEAFSGKVRRPAHAIDTKTRTMPIELDVNNSLSRLSPGMYAELRWPVTRPRPSMFVPPSAIAVTTERTFVIRIKNGEVEWVDVKRGAVMGNLIEVFGDLGVGDQVAVRGTDELRERTQVNVKEPAPAQ